jgi:predicted acyl esterase
MSKEYKVFYTKTPPLTDPKSNFEGFHPGQTLLEKGYQSFEGSKKLVCDIIFDRDVAIPLRDGTIIRADIFRPNNNKKVPAILNSSIFGKNKAYLNYDLAGKKYGRNNRASIPLDMTSGLETFEGVDPAFWCNNDYAVINIDIRGVGMSEGNAHYFGTQDAEDNYDVIEWLAEQPWCNEKVTMAGNSWLGITQWFTAALQPPHLACIAPWEGHADMYVDEYMRGGIPHISIVRQKMCFGNNEMEDLPRAMDEYPLFNWYWEDKRADFTKVELPAYVVAGYCSRVHTRGTFEGFRTISSKEKWLRVHNTQEWRDLYTHDDDLLKFYDYYLKEIDNGWTDTPQIRISVLDPGGTDLVDIVEQEFPIERQELKKMYFDIDNKKFDFDPSDTVKKDIYVSDDAEGMLKFVHTFEEETQITGYIKLKLWVEAESHNNADVYSRISKLNADGAYVYNDAMYDWYGGPNAMLRVSLRKLDEEKSTQCEPVHTFDEIQPLSKGEIVPIEVAFWPTSLLFHKGEKMEVVIAGFDFKGPQSAESSRDESDNKGRHVIYSGGEYDSHILVPFIPKK